MAATIVDIAREVGVSTTLVSFVMSNQRKGKKVYRVSEKTEKKILEAAARLNYQPNQNARALRSGISRVIGVIISDIANTFYAEIARAISDWAFQNDYITLFGNSDEDASKLDQTINILEAKGVDGFVIVPCEGSEKSIQRLKTEGMPFVLLDRDFPEMGTSSVTLDNFDASRRLVGQLAARGCKRIKMISYKTDLSNIRSRQTGFEAGLSEAGLISAGVHFPEYGDYEQVKAIICKAKDANVDGILFATYRMALLGRKAMFEIGYSECQIACFNYNEEMDTYENSIIFAKQPIEQFAYEALGILMDKIHNSESRESKILLPAELVIKE